MSDFWNVNLTGKCARQSTCTRWWGERERETDRERETSNPASLCTENASLSSLRCGAHHHSTFIHAFLSLHNNQCINYTQAQFTDPCSRQCCTTRSAESPRNPTITHQFVLNDTKQKKRAHLFYLLVWSVSCVRWESSLSETHSILLLNIMSRGDGETSCGATWKRSPGLHRDTIKCRLTRCLDGDGKDAAATAPMKGYPYTIRSSLEPPRSWPQRQLVIAAKKKKEKKKKRHSCERRCAQPIETRTSVRSSTAGAVKNKTLRWQWT